MPRKSLTESPFIDITPEIAQRDFPWLCSKSKLDLMIEFYNRYIATHPPEVIRVHLEKHLQYGTVDYVLNDLGEVIGLCRWNISDDGKVCKVIDLAIDDRFRHRGIGRYFLTHGLKLWKKIKFIEFERLAKKRSERRQIPIKAILKTNIF